MHLEGNSWFWDQTIGYHMMIGTIFFTTKLINIVHHISELIYLCRWDFFSNGLKYFQVFLHHFSDFINLFPIWHLAGNESNDQSMYNKPGRTLQTLKTSAFQTDRAVMTSHSREVKNTRINRISIAKLVFLSHNLAFFWKAPSFEASSAPGAGVC